MARKDRGSVGQGWKIWRESDLPFAKKAAVALKNNMRKAARLKDCCGNYGEPGC